MRYLVILLCFCLSACDSWNKTPTKPSTKTKKPLEFYEVHPGMNIQDVLDRAALNRHCKVVHVHAGVYRPAQKGQALIWLNRDHEGIHLKAVGNVTLTAENPEISNPREKSHPAVVNHVVYFGDGISNRTIIEGFTITGANGFVTRRDTPGPIELPNPMIKKSLFFYTDGGGIKVFAQSYPTILCCTIVDNYASPCAGGISIEHQGYNDKNVVIRDCVFRGNRCQVTGAAIDLLPGSAATIENCLFVGNISNLGEDNISREEKYNAKHGSGALTVFPNSRITVTRSTFVGNWNGVDDKGVGNTYEDCIFWQNNAKGGISPGSRYEIDILDGSKVKNCFLAGDITDLRGTVSKEGNNLSAPDPKFDKQYQPQIATYENIGYRAP